MSRASRPSRRPIRKLLVANRGEIARRVIHSARELGIATVAPFANDDAGALFVEEADESFPLAGESPRETYLSAGALIAAARATGADAIHPGYGFLSESALFASAVAEAGLVFVGPSPEAIARLGSKTAAKQLAAFVGVATIPWADATRLSPAQMAGAARAIGFPLLVKASAGGGGRGMRVVTAEAELAAAADVAHLEAERAFGDGSIFLERLLVEPRHVEVQILGDGHGRVVHLCERECSIQRRHQKIVEEAPSPAVDAAMRERLTAAAVKIGAAANYAGAGTVEFLLDSDGSIYFMEVNTRLQVEHPVTEAITGIDLVLWQLRIAAGEALSLAQDALVPRGHAIEARITAEDAARGFAPAGGRIAHFIVPAGAGVRVDTGVRAGDVVSTRYDSLLAKVIVHAEDRARAVARMERALRETVLLGPPSNLEFLLAVVRNDAFRRGETTTGFLATHERELAGPRETAQEMAMAIGLFEALGGGRSLLAPSRDAARDSAGADPWDSVRGFRAGA